MRRYIAARVVELALIVLGVTMLTFAGLSLAGGDAVDVFYERAGGAVSAGVMASRRAALGLDAPLPVQYGRWLAGALTLDLGRSYISGRDVGVELASRLPATAELMALAIALTLVASVPLGTLAAARQGSVLDRAVRYLSFVGTSVPSFFVALLLLYLLAVRAQAVAVTGGSVALPALTLAISMGARYTRQVRAVVLGELTRDYVVGARARGIPEWRVLCMSVLRTALPTLVTLIALSVGALLGGTVIVETIFMWDGVGRLALEAIMARDYPILAAYVVWMCIIYVTVNLLADLASRALDPRLRREVRR